MRIREDYRTLTGPEKAAILMLSIGEEQATRLFALMDDEEIREVSQTMSNLGTVHASVIERLFVEFTAQIPATGSLAGAADSSDRLLETLSGDDRSKLADQDEGMLASRIGNEHPQTAAIALSKIRPEQAASVLGQLPEAFATEVVMRMLRQAPAQKTAADHTDAARTAGRDPQEVMAKVFSGFDRTADSRLMPALEERNRASAERMKALMFTFEDLARLDPGSVQTLLRSVDKSKLAVALKGASEPLRTMVYANLSERAGRKLREEILALGPVKLRDVDEAQMYMVALAKELGARDEIALADRRGDDELIY